MAMNKYTLWLTVAFAVILKNNSSVQPTMSFSRTERHQGVKPSPLHANKVHSFITEKELHSQNYGSYKFECPSEYGYYPAYMYNCSSYYACHDGKPTLRECRNGLYFNAASTLCDEKSNVICNDQCWKPDGSFPVFGNCRLYLHCKDDVGTFRACSGNEVFDALTQRCDLPENVICPLQCPELNILLQLPGRCNQYVQCIGGHLQWKYCPHNLHFNPLKKHCDYPELAKCALRCRNRYDIYPVLGQCRRYVQCQDYVADIKICPSGLHFNFLRHTCDFQNTSMCALKCNKPNGFMSIPGLCNLFVMCIKGKPHVKDCPSGLMFHHELKQCASLPSDYCFLQCTVPNGSFPFPNKCDTYVECLNGHAKVKYCPQNTHFHAGNNICSEKQSAKCQLECPFVNGQFPVAGRCNMYSTCRGNESTTYVCSPGLHYNSQAMNCDLIEKSKCQCPKEDGMFLTGTDCRTFIRCKKQRSQVTSCPIRQQFNTETLRCDSPLNVGCLPPCPMTQGKYPMPGSCEYFYSCYDGKRTLDKCQDGYHYDAQWQQCIEAANTTCQPHW